ncbi:unnamed protein product [Calypogeia fissa]
MASSVPRPISNGTASPDRSDDKILDGEPPSPRSPAEFKSPDGNWDAMSGSFDSPRSSVSTSSIESPYLSSSASMSRSASGKMKSKRNQSSYYDEGTGTWKCRNCGGTYDMPNPGSRQRREHKKACEDTQRLQAIKRAEQEQQRREEAAREAAEKAAREAAEEIARAEQEQFRREEEAREAAEKVAQEVSEKAAREAALRDQELPEASNLQARREEAIREAAQKAAREAALRDQELEAASKSQEILRKRNTDDQLQNGQSSTSKVRDDSAIIGAFATTPDIPEREEVNFEAPKELIHNIERDPSGHLQETQTANAQVSISTNGQQQRLQQDGAELDRMERNTTAASGERVLPPKLNLSETYQGQGGKAGSPLKTELAGESRSVSGSSTPPTTDKVHQNGGLDHHWIDKASPSPKNLTSEELEQVKYCSSPPSDGAHLEGTLYDRLVDLHDDRQVVLTRSATMAHGRYEPARIASPNHDTETAKGVNFTRAFSMDHYGVGVTTRKDLNTRAATKLEHVTSPTTIQEDYVRDATPEDLIEVLIGRDHSRPPSLSQGVEIKQDLSKVLVNGVVDSRVGHFTTAVPSVISKRTQLDSPRALSSTREQSGSPKATNRSSKQPQSQSRSPRGSGAGSRNEADRPQDDDNLGAMIARNVGKFWRHYAAVGAVAVIAWVGKSLSNRQQRSRGQQPRCGRGQCVLNSRYYWDE